MATLSRLVETVAQVEGMDPATVALFARTVREAGLIRTGGRGLSAAKMSFADATNLLIAVNASLSVRESARTVRRFRSLNAYYIPDGGDSVRLQRVSFGYALEELLKISAEEAWPKTFLTVTIPTGVFEAISESDFAITIAFHKPVPIVKLNIWGSIHGPWVGPEYMSFHFDKRIRELDDDPLPGGKLYRRIYPHDREETTEIGYRTIHAVSKLLRDGN